MGRRTVVKLFYIASLLLFAPACTTNAAPDNALPDGASSDTAGSDAADAKPDGPRCEASSTQPAPRGDGAGVVDPATGRLYVFGGDTGPVVRCIPAPVFNAETWRYDPTCDRWDAVMGEAHPSPRSRMAWALDTRRRRMVVFGGRFRAGSTGSYTLYNDVWAFDLATETWEAITPEGEAPAARSNAAAVYDPERDALVLFGGNTSVSGLTFTPRNDTWALDLAQRTWRRVATTGAAPTARLFHSAALVGRAMLVYGGGGANAFMGPFYRDAARLDLDTGAWSPVALTGDTDALAGRISASLVATGGDALLVGGHDDGALGNRNDLLRVGADGAVSVVRAGDALGTPGSGFCDFPPDFATADEASPERRSGFVLAVDPARNRAIVYGGKTDCGLAGDVWSLDLAAGAWRSLRSTNDGLSCQRTGRENCRSLCN
jgi:hypothetical protein